MNIGNRPPVGYPFAARRRRTLPEHLAAALLAVAWGTATVAWMVGVVVVWPLWLVWRAVRAVALGLAWLVVLPKRWL